MRVTIWWERAEKRGEQVAVCHCCGGPLYQLESKKCVHCVKEAGVLG